MKTCRKGLHQYDENIKGGCRECKLEGAKRQREKPGAKLKQQEYHKQAIEVEREWKKAGCPIGELKTCRKGIHQYPVELRKCPKCNEEWKNERWLIPGNIKTCKRGLHQYSSELPKCPECFKIWKATPEAKAKAKARKQTPEYKAKAKLYKQTPKYKAKAAEYSKSEKGKATRRAREQKPENKEKKKEKQKKYSQSPKGKAKKKAYSQSPKGKENKSKGNRKYDNSEKGKATKKAWAQSPKGIESRKSANRKWKATPAGRASMIVSSAKRSIIAANGDLTGQQILERKEEFNGQCAYCHIELLTAKDNVDQTHPQYETIDHIIPLFDDGNPKGEHTKANVIPACYKCNCTSKLNQDVWEWMKEKNITPSKKLIPILNKATGKRKRYR